jgi:hypothetical protein
LQGVFHQPTISTMTSADAQINRAMAQTQSMDPGSWEQHEIEKLNACIDAVVEEQFDSAYEMFCQQATTTRTKAEVRPLLTCSSLF